MRTPTVFLIGGYARSGKDTLGNAIADLIPGTRKVAFADILKDAGNLFLERLSLHGSADLHRDFDKTRFRDFLVAGGKMARALDPDVFANAAARTAYINLLAGRCVVMTDWRYANELTAVQTICAPYKVVTVLLYRTGVGPANEEESIHMHTIEDTCRVDHVGSFADGATAAIRDLAHDLAAAVPSHPAA